MYLCMYVHICISDIYTYTHLRASIPFSLCCMTIFVMTSSSFSPKKKSWANAWCLRCSSPINSDIENGNGIQRRKSTLQLRKKERIKKERKNWEEGCMTRGRREGGGWGGGRGGGGSFYWVDWELEIRLYIYVCGGVYGLVCLCVVERVYVII